MSHEANVSLQGNFKFGEAGYMPYRVSGGYLNEKGTLKTSSMERGTIALNLTPTFFDDHLTISLNGKGMFQNNRFANTGAIPEPSPQPSSTTLPSLYTARITVWTDTGCGAM